MKLKSIQSYTDVTPKGRVHGELHTALLAYTSHFHEATDQSIEVWPLLVQMVQRFVESGREFLTWRRRTQNGLGTGSATS
jgi:hypothetical protein